MEGYEHILGGLEKDGKTGAISTDAENHHLMDNLRFDKVARIPVPDLEVQGDKDDADLLIVGFGSTYGHLYSAMQELRAKGHKIALAQFKYVNPLPKNTAALLRIRSNNFAPYQYNQVKGQPFVVQELVQGFERLLTLPAPKDEYGTFYSRILQ